MRRSVGSDTGSAVRRPRGRRYSAVAAPARATASSDDDGDEDRGHEPSVTPLGAVGDDAQVDAGQQRHQPRRQAPGAISRRRAPCGLGAPIST